MRAGVTCSGEADFSLAAGTGSWAGLADPTGFLALGTRIPDLVLLRKVVIAPRIRISGCKASGDSGSAQLGQLWSSSARRASRIPE